MPFVHTYVDHPSCGSLLNGCTMYVVTDRTRGSFSIAFMRWKIARTGGRKSSVLPPPRIIGSVRHAIVGLTLPTSLSIKISPTRLPVRAKSRCGLVR